MIAGNVTHANESPATDTQTGNETEKWKDTEKWRDTEKWKGLEKWKDTEKWKGATEGSSENASSSPTANLNLTMDHADLSADDLTSLNRLSDYFAQSSERDGVENSLSIQDLNAIVADTEVTSQETRDAAQSLLDNPELFSKIDKNGDNEISSTEMSEYMLPLKKMELDAKVAGDPAAQAAVGELIANDNFVNASPEEQLAILSQAENNPSERAITNLNRMQDQQWYQDMSVEDKQRSALAIGYMSSDPNSDQEIVDNTLDNLIGENAEVSLVWEAAGDSGPAAWTDSTRPNEIIMNSDSLGSAGNYGITEEQHAAAGDLLTSAIAHEMNHLLNNDHENIATGKQEFESELRAWRVGFEADNGRPPTNLETSERALSMLGLDGEPAEYPLLQTLFTTDEASQNAMMGTLNDIWGGGDLSLEELLATEPSNPAGASEDLGVISENDPNNLDNSTDTRQVPDYIKVVDSYIDNADFDLDLKQSNVKAANTSA